MKRFDTLLKAFPRSRYHQDFRLLSWQPEGVLDDERADRVVEFLEFEEAKGAAPFHRYTDLSKLSHIQLSLDHVFTMARRRTKSYRGSAVKSAFFAVRLIGLTIAKMYQELMQDAPIEVCVFRDREAAANWLGVPVGILTAPPVSGSSLEVPSRVARASLRRAHPASRPQPI
jgi:hypothetical protein